jgi:signal transduction histidine kinase/CheY-like chemotaxis protein
MKQKNFPTANNQKSSLKIEEKAALNLLNRYLQAGLVNEKQNNWHFWDQIIERVLGCQNICRQIEGQLIFHHHHNLKLQKESEQKLNDFLKKSPSRAAMSLGFPGIDDDFFVFPLTLRQNSIKLVLFDFLPGHLLYDTTTDFIEALTSFFNYSETLRLGFQFPRETSSKNSSELESLYQEKLNLIDLKNNERSVKALRKLAGGIAHEFNNQISVVLGNLELLSDDSLPKKLLENSRNATQKMLDIIQHLLIFSDKIPYEFNDCDLNEIVKNSLETFKNDPDQIPFEIETSLSKLPPLRLDEKYISHVILELLHQITSHMKAGEKIQISTRLGAQDIECLITSSHSEIDTQTIEELKYPLTPELLLKQASSKTSFGFSLATATSIISQHQGKLIAQNLPEQGFLFGFRLPRPLGERSALERKYFRLLLLDACPERNKKIAAHLETMGFSVSATDNSFKALNLLRDFGPHLVLISDTLQEMSCWDFLCTLEEFIGSLPVVLVADTISSGTFRKGLKHGIIHFIESNFSEDEIQREIRSALEEYSLDFS